MTRARKLLLAGGLALAVWGMSYGLYYALFDEHQTLEQIGGSLAASFVSAAEGKLPEAHAALDRYAAASYEYVREVDVHSHWIGLAMLLILMGVIFDRVAFNERKSFRLAVALVTGSVVFPLGVILQTAMQGQTPRAIAVAGSALIIIALALIAVGFWRKHISGGERG